MEQEGEWLTAQVAINEVPCIPFSIHRSSTNKLSEQELMALLERNAAGLIELYGDARCPRLDEALKEGLDD